jgi:hypothetical protein
MMKATAAIIQTASRPWDGRCGVVWQLHPLEESAAGVTVIGASAGLPASAALGAAMQAPALHSWPAAQVWPQAPQLLLSVATMAQYGALPSGAHKVELWHVMLHSPPEQTCPEGQAFPQVPQLLLSVAVVAQNGLPPSWEHKVCPRPQAVLHLPPPHT